MKKILGFVAACILLVSCGTSNAGGSGDSNNKTETKGKMYFIPIVETGTYWGGIIKGAKEEADKLGYELVIKTSPPSEPDKTAKHIGFIDEAIADPDTKAIAFSAVDKDAFDRKLGEAKKKGIPVVTFDGDTVTEANRDAYIGTNNYDAGVVLGENVAKFLKEKNVTDGNLAVVAVNMTSKTMIDRLEGAKEGFGKIMEGNASKFTWNEPIIDEDQMSVSKAGLESQIIANTDMRAVFSLGSEGPDNGTMEAIKAQKKEGSIYHFGFDFTPSWGNGVEKGLIEGIVDQDSKTIGKTCIEVLDKLVNKETVEDNYPIDVKYYDLEALKKLIADNK